MAVPVMRVPRASGDKPATKKAAKSQRRVFPAPAGINREVITASLNATRVPRASGDKPHYLSGNPGIQTCSPRQRG
ncbi:hypothetical protein IZS38_000921 [Salmonella enterica subsp. enterica serovar Plymouth]|nr:hypothetical protein [Salmonella enterica subsp. enterica serovar Plymouth]HAK0242623.1 hypothetical protein [Salmonella enterica]